MADHTRPHTTMAHKRKPHHPNNILLDHNLLLITQYHMRTLKHKTTQTFDKYLNHIQTKDNKFIHPPLKITNLKISTQDRNVDKDILNNKPTIQTPNSETNSETHIYNQNGNYMATITTKRLHWLWNQYSHNKFQHLTTFLQPPTRI